MPSLSLASPVACEDCGKPAEQMYFNPLKGQECPICNWCMDASQALLKTLEGVAEGARVRVFGMPLPTEPVSGGFAAGYLGISMHALLELARTGEIAEVETDDVMPLFDLGEYVRSGRAHFDPAHVRVNQRGEA